MNNMLLPLLAFALTLPFQAGGSPVDPKDESAFLGVGANRLSPLVSRQLGLGAKLYLSVNRIVPGSPAEKAGLKQYDILKKLDDQVLVNEEQLAELVRSRKVGDEVTLTILRAGKEKVLSAKLQKEEEPKDREPRQLFNERAFPNARELADRARRQIERRQEAFGLNRRELLPEVIEKFDVDGDGKLSPLERDKARDEGALGEEGIPFGLGNQFFRAPNLNLGPDFQQMLKDARRHGASSSWSSVSGTAKTKVVNVDQDGTYEFSSEDGDKRFKATSLDGEVLFDGPVNTDEERAALPDGMLDRLETLEKSVRIRINPREAKPGKPKQEGRKDKRFL